jgi:hypothetical protein
MNARYSLEEKDCWEHLYLLGFSSERISEIRGVKKPSVKAYIKSLGVSRSHSEAQKGREPWNKGATGLQVAWNKGIPGPPSPNRGKPSPLKGKQRPPEVGEKIRESWRIRLESGWNDFGGYGRKPTPEQRLLPGTLYLIRYLDESGTHFKIGITKRSLNERFKSHQLISIIHLHTATLGECFDLEQDCLRYCKQQGWRYSSPTTTELIHPDGIPYLLQRLTALSPTP